MSTSGPPRITVNPVRGPSRPRGWLIGRIWRAFATFRRTRPFWGGLWCILGGLFIAYGPTTAIRIILVSGMAVWLGITVGVLVVLMGLFLWFTPQMRQVVGIMAVIFSIISLLTSDYGGFLIGMLLGMLGGAMGFAWVPTVQRRPAAPR
jgi:hypothetical protein